MFVEWLIGKIQVIGKRKKNVPLQNFVSPQTKAALFFNALKIVIPLYKTNTIGDQNFVWQK